MIMGAIARVITPCLFIAMLFLSGCRLEQGKLHFDKLNLNPITVYAMSPLETTIYCVAEGDFPSGDILEEMHRQSYQQIENNPEEADWGELVCLSLSEDATVKQMKETNNVLLLVLASRQDSRGAVRGFRKLIEQKISLINEIEEHQQILDEKAKERTDLVSSYEDRMNMYELKLILGKQAAAKLEEKVRDLEQQVQKLKEVELLLQPNKTTK